MSKIILCHCNRIDYLKVQLEAYRKKCKDLDEIVVVNDGLTRCLRQDIKSISSDFNVECWNTPLDLDHSSPSVAVGAVFQWSYDIAIKRFANEKVAFLDADLFPLRDFRISDFLQKEKSIAALSQDRQHVKYLWPGFVFMSMGLIPRKETINWTCGVVECQNVDTMGLTYYHLKECGIDHIKFLNHTSHLTSNSLKRITCCPDHIKSRYKLDYKIEVMEDSFIHCGRSSGWDGAKGDAFGKEKTEYVMDWLRAVGSIE